MPKTYTADLWRTRHVYESASITVTEAELKQHIGVEDLSACVEDEIKVAIDEIADKRGIWKLERSEIWDGYVKDGTLKITEETTNG